VGEGELERSGEKGKKARDLIVTLIWNGAAVPLGPWAQVGAAATTATAIDYAEKMWSEWHQDGAQRVEDMFDRAREEAGEDSEQFSSRASATEETRIFTGQAATAAFNTAWDAKVQALGRLLAAGLIDASGGVAPIRTYALAAMAEMEQFDVALLNVLVSFQSGTFAGGPEFEPFVAQAERWSLGRREWTVEQIKRFRPQLAALLPGLLGTLQRHGLAVQNDSSSETVERTLKEVINKYNSQLGSAQRGGRSTLVPLQEPAFMPEVERTWSPTEFGALVLSYYHEAAL
jgi:hypothetical protein